MCYIAGRRQIYTGFSCRNLKGRSQMEELGIDGQIILKCIYMSIQSNFVVVYISCYKPDTKMLSISSINKFLQTCAFILKLLECGYDVKT
jgi:hypothetical protein